MQVSVVMAVYNNDCIKILKAAIDSILMQTFNDYELIICDDASTDKTYEVLCDIAKTDMRIHLLQNKRNLKAGGARNACFSVAQGDFIAIMDSDDISHPQRLEKQLAFLNEHNEFDFVGSRGQFFYNDIHDNMRQYWFCKEPQKEDFLFTLPFVHGSILFRRSAIERVKGYSLARVVQRSEDYDMLMRMYKQGMSGANIDEVLYFIRQNENTYKRRKYKYRFNEAVVKYKGFSKMGLMPKGLLYAVKPLIVGLIPIPLLNKLKEGYFKDNR